MHPKEKKQQNLEGGGSTLHRGWLWTDPWHRQPDREMLGTQQSGKHAHLSHASIEPDEAVEVDPAVHHGTLTRVERKSKAVDKERAAFKWEVCVDVDVLKQCDVSVRFQMPCVPSCSIGCHRAARQRSRSNKRTPASPDEYGCLERRTRGPLHAAATSESLQKVA